MYFNQKSILAADYLRLSREDGDKLESDSIRNQRSLINDFVNSTRTLPWSMNILMMVTVEQILSVQHLKDCSKM